ncbi:MAG: hypothetical protein C5B50_30070 [Verrucomicrobia bacterium]|nr:MAG: hypothetical protein C5B50_30070 [Verrucomicrobiota bacterium]
MTAHLKRLVAFYFVPQSVSLASRYGPHEALSRIRDVAGQGNICVLEATAQKIQVAANHPKSNTFPVFEGVLEGDDAPVRLRGYIRFRPEVLFALWVFTVILLFFLPVALILRPGLGLQDWGTSLCAICGWITLLEGFYLVGRDDPIIIRTSLAQALGN